VLRSRLIPQRPDAVSTGVPGIAPVTRDVEFLPASAGSIRCNCAMNGDGFSVAPSAVWCEKAMTSFSLLRVQAM